LTLPVAGSVYWHVHVPRVLSKKNDAILFTSFLQNFAGITVNFHGFLWYSVLLYQL